MARIEQLSDVVAWRLCTGCGTCAAACPEQRVVLFDLPAEGIRPTVTAGDCLACTACLDACPAVATDFGSATAAARTRSEVDDQLAAHWGPVLEIWEGHAASAEIRFRGASGGVLTALSVYAVEQGGLHGVLHTAKDPDSPGRNRTRLSRTRADLVAATGSRYSPASVGNGLGLVESSPAPCVIVGQPSEIAGVVRAAAVRPGLADKIGLTLSFFCAGSPATAGTRALLARFGIVSQQLSELRYRGWGWPGHFTAEVAGAEVANLTYRDSWAFLQSFRPWSVQMWPDGSGELADISCGDPWYRQPDGVERGSSLVVVRTERGRALLHRAIEAGYVKLTPAEPWKLERSQAGLRRKKGAVWGRRLALQCFGLPVSRLTGTALFRCWWELGFREKVRSVLGTLRRVVRRRLYRRGCLDLVGAEPVPRAVPAEMLRAPASPHATATARSCDRIGT